MFRRLTTIWCLIGMALLGNVAWGMDFPATEGDIQVVDAKWGFDGFSRYKTFVPLRVILKNRSPTHRTLTIRLTREDALNDEGETLEQEVILAGETTRVVQFVPFVSDPGETWTFRWGDGEEESTPIRSESADDGVVLITSATELTHRTGSLHAMREDEFPTSITALDALRVVILDQEPRWTGARRKGFQEWLFKGGHVVLLDSPGGEDPKFADGFEYLNVDRKMTRYGLGIIQRMPRVPQDVTRSVIEKEVLGRKLTGGDLDQRLQAYENSRWNRVRQNPIVDPESQLLSYSRDSVLSDLKGIAGTRKNWGLIYLAIFLYVGWQWRVGWRWGLIEKQPNRFYGWLAGLAGAFALAFLLVGQMGAAGSDRVRTVVVAHRFAPGIVDVEGWSVLATGLNAGEHQFTAPGSGQIYGGTESFGQNPLLVRDAKLQVDLAAYTVQKVAFRSRVEMPDIPVLLNASGPDMWQSKSARIELAPNDKRKTYAAVVFVDGKVYEFSGKTGTLKPSDYWGMTMHAWLSPHSARNMKRLQWRTSFLGWLFDTTTNEELYRDAFVDVVGNGFSIGPTIFPNSFTIPEGYARVMLYTDLPTELAIKWDFPDQDGRMLYVVDLPLSGGQ